MTSLAMNEHASDPFPLERYRERWNIEIGRDGINLFSALRKPTATSIVYLVAHTSRELAALIRKFEAEEEQP